MKMEAFLYMCVAISGLITSLYAAPPEILFEDSPCNNKDDAGICTLITKCSQADNDVIQYGHHNYTRCGFLRSTELVCCPTELRMLPTLRLPNVTTSTRKCETACNKFAEIFPNAVFPQIAGGQNASLGQFPYMAALGYLNPIDNNYYFRCGGTLISEKYVVTAAHCLFNSEEQNVTIVRLGVIDVPEFVEKTNSTIDFAVKNFSIHPKYNTKYEHNDIGLIELENPIQLRFDLRPACLFTGGINYPEEYIITGWGEINQNGIRSSILQTAFVNYLPFQKCTERYSRLKRPLIDTQLCAVHDVSDICQGDSGGPLLKRNSRAPVVVGVSSFGQAGCSGGSPSVYTSISQHLEWIENMVWQ